MKSNAAQPSLYFSAYPLKAITGTNSESSASQSPFLKAILSGKTKTLSRVRVFAMTNPYKETHEPLIVPKASSLPNDIELSEKDWFNNYE